MTTATPSIAVGDTVRVRDPDSWPEKFRERDAVVLQVGPTPTGMFKGQAFIRFQKRNGRGKEFEEWAHIRHLVKATP
jgi:hypothetical protein